MNENSLDDGWRVECYREYLLVMARGEWSGRNRQKCDVSDLVQQTLLHAHQHRGQFRGASEGERKAWSGAISKNQRCERFESAAHAEARPGSRERSLEAVLEQHAAGDGRQWAVEHDSPSEFLIREERRFRLADCLNRLSDDECAVVELRHLDACSIKEIGERMGRSNASVAGLLRRGMEKLLGAVWMQATSSERAAICRRRGIRARTATRRRSSRLPVGGRRRSCAQSSGMDRLLSGVRGGAGRDSSRTKSFSWCTTT